MWKGWMCFPEVNEYVQYFEVSVAKGLALHVSNHPDATVFYG